MPAVRPVWPLRIDIDALPVYNPAMESAASAKMEKAGSIASVHPQSYLGLHCINVYVRDQERSLRFYRDVLGFHVAFDARLQSGERWVAVSPPDGTAILSLVLPRPDTQEHKLIGHSTQVVFITEDVPAKFQEWVKRGVRFHVTPRLRRIKYDANATDPSGLLGQGVPIWGGVFARFKDIDGNSFTLVSFDEVTRSLETQRRAAAEKLEAERRAAQEMEIAKQVQSNLFPQTLPSVQTLDYAGTCLQARQVGGDYYDFLDLGSLYRLDRGATRPLPAAAWHLAFVLADISGKGMAAALLMANLQANLRSRYALALDDLPRLLCSVNQLFMENTPADRFATLFFAVYDDHSRELEYANCGHNAPLLLRANGSVERLVSTSTVIGVFFDWECVTQRVVLAPGDLLAIYTDGVTESFDDSGNEFGESRLIEVLCRNRELPAQALVGSVVDEVRRFSPLEQHDDITLIIAKSR
jgi:serine phosphatase RsbU (regulator of sigma subunit)/catechol 2,3-dioxygenase-like lactoylglutathione lyase family enzyme